MIDVSRLSPLAGRYRIERALGAGGMATVFLAEDVRHQRKVALKVLHPELAAVLGSDRFLAEITTTATLQHPGILPLFDSGVVDGLVYYVMPYVPGESLRQRLERERQLPVDEVVRITTTIAAALDYAHRQGVIHRDVKPENVLLQDGHPLVADFGIALAVTNAGGARLTQTGLSLGTPQYMSPEQAAGERVVDKRTDIYSLGAVAYEMLSGEPPFTAPSTQAVLAKLMSEDPRPLRSLRKSVPSVVEAAVHRALEKLPADRWSSVADFAGALGRAGDPASERRPRGLSRPAVTVLVAASLVAFAAGVAVGRLARSRAAPDGTGELVRHWAISLPDSAPFAPVRDASAAPRHGIAISPDGNLVAYAGQRGATSALHLVRLATGSTTALAGTEGARLPAFSPDGRWLAFVADGELRKVSVDGGAVVRLAPLEAPVAFFWVSDERLLVSRSAIGAGTVPASGGRFEPLGERFHAVSFLHTQLLPGGRYLGATAFGELATISVETGTFRFITAGYPDEQDRAEFGRALRGRNVRYLSSGHLVYASGASLMAVPFDVKTHRLTGKPAPIVADIWSEGGPGEAHFAVSDEGTLVYAPGHDGSRGMLVWSNRNGTLVDSLPLRPANLLAMRLSHDGRKLALVERLPNSPAELRIVDLVRGLEDQARVSGEFSVTAWSRDNRAVLGYQIPDSSPARACCFIGAQLDVATFAVHVTEAPEPYRFFIEYDESPDRAVRCMSALSRPHGPAEVLVLHRMDKSVPPRMLTTAVPGDCTFSPDGAWVAYTHRDGLFVTRASVDTTLPAFRIVPGATSQARWTPDGKEILYRGGRRLYAVAVRTGREGVDSFEPRVLFAWDGLDTSWDGTGSAWDVGPDGRLLLWRGPSQSPATRLSVITNVSRLIAERVRADADTR